MRILFFMTIFAVFCSCSSYQQKDEKGCYEYDPVFCQGTQGQQYRKVCETDKKGCRVCSCEPVGRSSFWSTEK